MNTNDLVGISKIKNLKNRKEIKNSIFYLLDEMKKREPIKIPINSKIFIKPNICLVKCCESGTTVDPFIVKFLVDWLIENYNPQKIIIGEADATQLNIDVAFKVLGWEHIFSEYSNVQLLNLSKDDNVKVNLNGLYFENLDMSKIYMESDYLISVGKLKTHTITGITCILKNQYGANPIKYKAPYHQHLDEVICDLNMVRMPDLCLVDGIIAMEGKGPVNGIPKPMGLLIIGNNALITDHACAKVMGFKPNKITHLKLIAKETDCKISYDTFGEDIKTVQTNFELISSWENILGSLYNNKAIKKIMAVIRT